MHSYPETAESRLLFLQCMLFFSTIRRSLSFFFVILSILLPSVCSLLSVCFPVPHPFSVLCPLAMLPARIGRRLLYCMLAADNKWRTQKFWKVFFYFLKWWLVSPYIHILFLICNCLSPSNPFKWNKVSFLGYLPVVYFLLEVTGMLWCSKVLQTASALQLLFLF